MANLGHMFAKEYPDDGRREGRRCAEGSVKIAGETYELVDWSSSGFQAKGLVASLDKGGRVPIEFTVTIDDVNYFFECCAVIVRLDDSPPRLAAVFVEMDDEDRLAVAQYFEDNDPGNRYPG